MIGDTTWTMGIRFGDVFIQIKLMVSGCTTAFSLRPIYVSTYISALCADDDDENDKEQIGKFLTRSFVRSMCGHFVQNKYEGDSNLTRDMFSGWQFAEHRLGVI